MVAFICKCGEAPVNGLMCEDASNALPHSHMIHVIAQQQGRKHIGKAELHEAVIVSAVAPPSEHTVED